MWVKLRWNHNPRDRVTQTLIAALEALTAEEVVRRRRRSYHPLDLLSEGISGTLKRFDTQDKTGERISSRGEPVKA